MSLTYYLFLKTFSEGIFVQLEELDEIYKKKLNWVATIMCQDLPETMNYEKLHCGISDLS